MTFSSPPSAKRQRLDSPPPCTLLTRGSTWYDDGNIILQAESTQFRVYRGILVDNSTVFADMFGLDMPQPPEAVLVDGCAVVHLSDSAEDWRHVLHALYKRTSVCVPACPLPLPVVSAFLRIGSKYMIDMLRTEAIMRLTSEFPSNLRAYGVRRCGSMIKMPDVSCFFEVVTLAREHRILSILPVALYDICLASSIEDICKGILRGDVRVCLRLEDQYACTIGWRALLDKLKDETLSWLYAGETARIFDGCLAPTQCRAIRAQLLLRHCRLPTTCAALTQWNDHKWATLGMCDRCAAMARRSHEAGCRNVWDILPSLFGLPDWIELWKTSC